MTRRGVYLNLKESPYILEINGYRFYFSSRAKQAYFQRKYDKEALDRTYAIVNSLPQFFEPLTMDILQHVTMDIYKQCETKGKYYEIISS